MAGFFQKKHLSDYYTIILVSFPLGPYVHEVVDSQANYQRCSYDVYFLGCHTFAVLHSVNGEGIFIRTIFYVYSLKYSQWCIC